MICLPRAEYIFSPWILCSIFGLAIFLQKFHILQRKKLLPEEFLSSLYKAVETKGLEEAKSLSASNDSAVAKIALAAAQNSGKSKEEMEEAIEAAGKAEAQGLEKYIDTLLTISSISTLIGLLGTISGMIKVFAVISEKDIVDPPSLAGRYLGGTLYDGPRTHDSDPGTHSLQVHRRKIQGDNLRA